MLVKISFVCLLTLPWLIMSQLPYAHPGQYGPPANSDMYQQQQHQMQQQQQLPMHQQQQQQQPMPQQPQQQLPMQQQPQQQLPIHHQQQQQQQIPIHQQQQMQPQQPQQLPMHQQQQYYQGNMQGPQIQSPQGMQPPPLANQFQQPTNDHPAAQAPSPPSSSSERYLVGNLSEPFSFQVAPPSIRVTHLGLNGYSLYIIGVGFSNKSKFNYDEQNNRLTILSLDQTTVGYYTAVDGNWQTFVNVLSAIDVSSLQVRNSHASEDNNGSSLVSCSVSIIRSTFKLADPPSPSNNLAIAPPSSLPLPSRTSSALSGTENLPRLDLFISTRTSSSSILPNNRNYNDTLNEQIFTRSITLQRPLTRADHNGTIQCQVESNNNMDVYLRRAFPIEIAYGPNLETGAVPVVNLESEVLKPIALDCQIEANPTPSYVWYEMSTNISTGMMPYYGQQNPYGQQYPLQPPSNIPTAALNVFGITRQIQKIYQNPGQHAMQCQAQSGGKTVKQQFLIMVHPGNSGMKAGSNADGTRGKSYRVPMIIGLSIGGILLLLLVAIIIAVIIFLKRRKTNATEKRSPSLEKIPNDKQGGTAWSHRSNLAADHAKKYKHEVLKGDSSSTSHLVESAESSTSQPPPIPNRPSPITSTHSSYRQATVPISLSYQQANAFPGTRPPPPPLRSYSPDPDDGDEHDISVHAMPLTTNRSRTTTPFGSRKSLSESIQSFKSNQQPALSLPVKKRSQEPPPVPPPTIITSKRDQRTPSPKSFEVKKDYQHHHYHNPAQLRAQQKRTANQAVPSDDESEQLNNTTEDSAFLPKKFTFRVGAGPVASSRPIPIDQQHGRRPRTPPPPQKIAVHQPTAVHRDEPPPSYHQLAKPPPPPPAAAATTYAYQEPTEV